MLRLPVMALSRHSGSLRSSNQGLGWCSGLFLGGGLYVGDGPVGVVNVETRVSEWSTRNIYVPCSILQFRG